MKPESKNSCIFQINGLSSISPNGQNQTEYSNLELSAGQKIQVAKFQSATKNSAFYDHRDLPKMKKMVNFDRLSQTLKVKLKHIKSFLEPF